LSNPVTYDEVRRILRAEVGTTENPPGSNNTKYGAWYGYNGAPWCAMFQLWVDAKAGHLLTIKSAYTPTLAQYFIDHKRAGKTPRVGAYAFHNFDGSRIQHVSRVIDVINPTTVRTVEGNTSPSAAGSQENGDGVYIKTRSVRSGDIVLFGYPEYEKELPKFEYDKGDRVWFGAGDKGADVKRWQIDLNRWCSDLNDKLPADKERFAFHIKADGRFGPDTVKATKTFQTYYDLDVDGRVGKHTIDKMEAVRKRQEARD
jgi:murein L,D-transpeptidase YcbB/YkuD